MHMRTEIREEKKKRISFHFIVDEERNSVLIKIHRQWRERKTYPPRIIYTTEIVHIHTLREKVIERKRKKGMKTYQ